MLVHARRLCVARHRYVQLLFPPDDSQGVGASDSRIVITTKTLDAPKSYRCDKSDAICAAAAAQVHPCVWTSAVRGSWEHH